MPTGLGRISWVTALCVAFTAAVAGCQSHPSSRAAGSATSSVSPTVTMTSTAWKPVYQPTTPVTETFQTCAPGQLSVTYHGGGLGTGNNFGTILIANTGNATCQIDDVQVAVSPLDAAGRAIVTYPGWVNAASAARLTLSAHGGLPSGAQAPPGGDQWGAILLGGGGRDDPKAPNGLCAPGNEVTPYAWRVSGTFSLTIRNLDTYIAAHPSRGSPPGVYACADPYLDLLNIDTSQGSA